MSIVAIDKVVRDICAEFGDTDYKYYMKVMRFANDAMRDLSLFVLPNDNKFKITPQLLSRNQIQIVDLPKDFVYETQVKILMDNSVQTIDLSRNDNLEPRNDADGQWCDCPQTTPTDSGICGTCGYPLWIYGYDNWYQRLSNGELYGLSLDNNCWGYYKIDLDAHKIYLNGLPQEGTVIVEYKSNGVGEGAQNIPTKAENAIREYCLWKLWRSKPGTLGISDRAHKQYKIEYNKLKRLQSVSRERDYHDVILKNNHSSVKK